MWCGCWGRRRDAEFLCPIDATKCALHRWGTEISVFWELFGAEGLYGVDSGGAGSGDCGRDYGGGDDDGCGNADGERAGLLNFRNVFADDAGDYKAEDNACADSDERDEQAIGKYSGKNVAGMGAEGHANAELAGAAAN